MARVRMTDRFVAAAKAAGGRAEFFDEAVPGLALRVSETGRKSWVLHYTRPGSRSRNRLALGTYPVVSLADARAAVIEKQREIGQGTDPARAKQAEAQRMTLADLVESYISRYASTKRTGPAIARRLRKNVSPAIGAVPVADLHKRDLTRVVDAIRDRGAVTEAARVYEDVRAMVRWAAARGDIDGNPLFGMRKPETPGERERVLSTDEVATLWAKLPECPMSEATRRVVRLLLTTGQRVSELCEAHESEIDWQAAVWTVPAERVKNARAHRLPLSSLALELFREANATARDGHLFPSTQRGPIEEREGAFARPARPLDGHAVATAVRRAQGVIGIPHWTAHDLRRTAATHMAEVGVSPLVIGHVLNHITTTRASVTTSVYARYDYSREMREALELWGERLRAIVTGGTARVVPLRAEARP